MCFSKQLAPKQYNILSLSIENTQFVKTVHKLGLHNIRSSTNLKFRNKILIITKAYVRFEVLIAVRTNFTVVRNGTRLI